jgi:hypothetical protein
MEHPQIVESVTDVPGVTMEEDDQAAFGFRAGGDKPAVEDFAVAGRQFKRGER